LQSAKNCAIEARLVGYFSMIEGMIPVCGQVGEVVAQLTP